MFISEQVNGNVAPQHMSMPHINPGMSTDRSMPISQPEVQMPTTHMQPGVRMSLEPSNYSMPAAVQ